jgi:hypothetical protein
VHWSKFALALHPWNEPPHRLVNEANRLGQEITMPMIGQEYILGGSMHHATWWNM